MAFTEKHRTELEEKGYTVVENVLTESECGEHIQAFRDWLPQFPENEWPFSVHSLIQRYNIGHHDAAWRTRLKAKAVFSKLWKTDKLLTSVDAIAIGRPPEEGQEVFANDCHWLHVDQDSEKIGLHGFQGTVYLETVDEDDWTFHVMERSHLYLDRLYDQNQKVALKSACNKYYGLRDEDEEWFLSQGCVTKRVAVPRGGMVLWDSRLVHANARPIKGRKHPGRWRFCVMVCMTPASWATKESLDTKKEAYNGVAMTTHWPSQDVRIMSSLPSQYSKNIGWLTELPEIAKTTEVKQLCGVVPYDFTDDKPNGPDWSPKWKKGVDRFEKTLPRLSQKSKWQGVVATSGITLLVGIVAWAVVKYARP
ncbi:uncharacterized protein LOC110455311 [Mizuhopecten yessoensis]|uniref:Phytanoyl-CoA dioxygenase n=1 Tax=Mizuhopecten yessoensis TaxID=6573 RepID=A0A210QDC4_MIZYE|nr:uncharacterized protein LOC110455311 [Mizuhopecten yessoensis]OWF46725.1 hypothetical protein KP79_PYT21222 [Mizuhopecten yessoensis]